MFVNYFITEQFFIFVISSLFSSKKESIVFSEKYLFITTPPSSTKFLKAISKFSLRHITGQQFVFKKTNFFKFIYFFYFIWEK